MRGRPRLRKIQWRHPSAKHSHCPRPLRLPSGTAVKPPSVSTDDSCCAAVCHQHETFCFSYLVNRLSFISSFISSSLHNVVCICVGCWALAVCTYKNRHNSSLTGRCIDFGACCHCKQSRYGIAHNWLFILRLTNFHTNSFLHDCCQYSYYMTLLGLYL